MAKKQTLNLKITGLNTNPNQFSEIPPGALSKADNCVIDKGSVIESRRGFKKYGTQLTLTGIEKIESFHSYKNRILVHYANKLAYDSNGLGTWTNYSGTYEAFSGFKIRSIEQNGNLYFTTNGSIKKISSLTGTVGNSGIARGLDGSGTTTGASGFLANNSSIAYRIVWGIKDENNNLLLGAPSGRLIITNTSGGTRNTSLTWYIPDSVTTSYFYQVYRSQEVASTIEPSDELQLVYEANPSGAQITAKVLTFTDITPNDLRGAALYTNSSQEGILQANDQPPSAKDIALYKQMMFYANTQQKERLTITLIGVGGTGFVNGDTITIGGVTYTGQGSENASIGQFQIFTAGTASENIENTALSLTRIINQFASNTTIYAYYTSGYTDLPGRILLEERVAGGSSFAVTSSRGSAFNPVLPSSGTTVSSTDDQAQNRVYYSKVSQPEAVPLLNFLNVGKPDFPIERIIPLRDSVFILKKDGIFRIIGEDPSSLRISVFDNTTEIIGGNSAVEIANTIYMYSDQGIISCSDNGVQVMSRPIEDTLFKIQNFTDFSTTVFGISYESDRKYILFMKSLSGDANPTQAFVYNQFTNAWTRWEKNASAGFVFDGKIYLGYPTGFVHEERKDYQLTDYQDDEFPITITSSSGTIVNFTGATATIGMLLKQASTAATVKTVLSATSIELDEVKTWTNTSATLIEPIECVMEWAQESCGNPGILKRFVETTLLMRDSSFKEIQIGYSTNLSLTPEFSTVEPNFEGEWGTFPWGSLPWGGGSSNKPVPVRNYVPLEKGRGSWVYLSVKSNQAQNNFAISGVSLIYVPMTERFNN
jgi:hypothetical protein